MSTAALVFISMIVALATCAQSAHIDTNASPMAGVSPDQRLKSTTTNEVAQVVDIKQANDDSKFQESPKQQQESYSVSIDSSNESKSASPQKISTIRGSSTFATEKLKRGLTNFMSQLNPGPYFVPASAQAPILTPIKSVLQNGQQPDDVTKVTNDPTADSVIKGPNRLAYTGPIGGPLRWGRRR